MLTTYAPSSYMYAHHVCTELLGAVLGTGLWSPHAGAGTCTEASQHIDVSGGTKRWEGTRVGLSTASLSHGSRPACLTGEPTGPPGLQVHPHCPLFLPLNSYLGLGFCIHSSQAFPDPTALGSDRGARTPCV